MTYLQGLLQIAQAYHAIADAAARIQAKPRIDVQIRATASDRDRAEELLRNLRPQELAALKKKLGLAP